jgi:hypothetical protein
MKKPDALSARIGCCHHMFSYESIDDDDGETAKAAAMKSEAAAGSAQR